MIGMFRLLVVGGALCAYVSTANATVIYQEGAEAYNDNDVVSTSPPICQYTCTGSPYNTPPTAKARANCDPGATSPIGNMCYRWDIASSQDDYRTEFYPTMNYTVTEGEEIYFGYSTNFTRIGGNDIWSEGAPLQSGDKGVELRCTSLAVCRWLVSNGQWSSMCANTDHKWSVWGGNPTNHFNPSIEFTDAIRPNQAGYGVSCGGGLTTGPQLDYERWYNIVAGLKFADDSPKDGWYRVWVNGVLILEYTGIQVSATNTGSNVVLNVIEIGGTIAQNGYDAPAHTRYHDQFMVATTLADMASLMVDPEAAGAAARAAGGARFSGGVKVR